MKKILILLFSLVCVCCGIYAQQIQISGVVRDSENAEPLIGATVVIKGTTTGVTTDIDGKYTIEASVNQTLTYSYIGMKPYEVRITASTPTVLNVTLESDQFLMDEVVVVGYGVTKRRDLAGSISSLKPDDIEAGVISNMSQLLKGRAAGVQVRQNSLEPGGGVSIRIRGASSVSAENEPLYVVDGFQTDNMTHINPDDIESIEILKDASTTAIYGARGANGVILITTKKGQAGQFNVEYSYSGSVKMLYNPWDLLDAGETIALTRRLYEQDPTATSSKWTAEQALYRGKGTDWVEETTRNATTNLHQLSVSGGSDKLTAFVSANYMTEPGILLNTDYERFGGRTNINYKITDRIRAGANMSFAYSDKKFLDMGTVSSDQNIMYRIFNLEPWKDTEGYDVFGVKDRRPGVFDEMQGAQLYQKYHTLYASVFAEVDLLPTLTFRGQYTYGYDHLKTQKYYDRSTIVGGSYKGQAFIGHEETTRNQLEGIVTWNQKFGDMHDVKVIGGTSYIFQKGEGDETQAYGFASDVFTFKNIGAAQYLDWIGSGVSSLRKASFFGRAEYVLNDKYIFNASIRADGSSVFGADNRWGYFPAGSVAWHLGDESFMEFAKPVFSRIKLRTSYGLSGNDGIRFGLSQYQFSVRDVYVGGDASVNGMYPSNPYNPGLKWETTAQWNIGTDFTFLDGRIETSLDFYIKRTRDLLNPGPIHPSGGFPNYNDGRQYEYTAMMMNDGKIDNRGFELFIKSTNINRRDFTWNTSFNLSTNRSRVLELNEGEARFQYIRPHGLYDLKEYIILQEGQPLSAIYGYVFDGILQQGETYSAQPNSVAGDPKFKDINGDGIIDDNDRIVLGHGTPSVILGLNNAFTFRDFDFSFFFEASLGGKMLNLTRIYLEDNNRVKDSEQRWTQGGRVMTDENGESYTTSGYASNTVPRKGYQRNSEVQYGSYINSRFVENANYLKLRNIEIGYALPIKKWGNTKNYIKAARVFVGAQNLFTITPYTGFDPDISTNGSSAIAQGLDLNSYPTYRTFNFGAKVTF